MTACTTPSPDHLNHRPNTMNNNVTSTSITSSLISTATTDITTATNYYYYYYYYDYYYYFYYYYYYYYLYCHTELLSSFYSTRIWKLSSYTCTSEYRYHTSAIILPHVL